ncbi:MAG: alanine--glyoxylate aminotransferase family protein [Planctomycetes bacterium]|nr:alanine--glyoxylate aminotransferase family protein [Planctomycetota bacterium]
MTHFFAPGPIKIPDCLREALSTTAPYFAGKEFSKVLEQIQPRLQEVFNTDNPVMIGTGSGSLGMECAVTNFFSHGDVVIVLVTGKYGKNWSEMCQRHGLVVAEVSAPPGSAASKAELSELMSRFSKVKGVFITHVDTTTGILNPIEEFRHIIRTSYPNTLIVVDAICSLLTEQLVSSNYDVVISASQKALSLPPGLFFMTASRLAVDVASRTEERPFYFDVVKEYDRTLTNTTTFTPASNLIMALDVALRIIVDILTPTLIIDRSMILSTSSKVTLSKAGLSLFSKSPANAITVVYHSNSDYIISKLEESGIIIGSGVRELKGKIFRIMHFGWDTKSRDLDEVLSSVIHFADPYP